MNRVAVLSLPASLLNNGCDIQSYYRSVIHAQTVAKRTSLWHKKYSLLADILISHAKDEKLRSVEAFERQECQATILRENSTIHIFIVVIRIMRRLLQTVGEKNLHYTEHQGSYFETGQP